MGQQLISKWERGLAVPQDEKLALLRTVLKAPLEVPSEDTGPKTVYEEIRSRIEQGLYTPGTALPAQSSMATRYNVHIATVRRAVGRLIDEGWLTWRPGQAPVVRLRDPKGDDRHARRYLREVPFSVLMGGRRFLEPRVLNSIDTAMRMLWCAHDNESNQPDPPRRTGSRASRPSRTQ